MEVIVYTSKGCIFCIKQKEFLTEKGIVFDERDVNNSDHYYQEFKDLGGMGVPLTIVKNAGKIVSTLTGFKKEELSKLLIQN